MIGLPKLHPLSTAALIAALASVTNAQGVAAPAHFAATEANNHDFAPFSVVQLPCRYLQIHDDVPAGTYRELWLRRDGAQPATFDPLLLTVEMWMSTAARTASTVAPDFPTNHGANKLQILRRQQIRIDQTVPGSPIPLPSPFEYRILFDQPFTHQGGALCWEILVHGRSGTAAHFMDAAVGQNANPSPLRLILGSGCRSSGTGRPLVLDDSTPVNWPQGTVTLNYRGYNLQPNANAVLAFGVDNVHWNGLTLPFELPGTSMDPSGPCFLFAAPLVPVPVLVDGSGNFSYTTTAPLDASVNGANLFAQILALDAPANRWGIVSSNGIHRHFIAPFGPVPVSNLRQQGTGSIQVGMHAGLVVNLR